MSTEKHNTHPQKLGYSHETNNIYMTSYISVVNEVIHYL